MRNKKRFEGKVVVVTGASSGIGKYSAIEFAKEGADLALVSRSKEKLESVADEIKEFVSNVFVVPTDVSSEEQVNKATQNIISHFGTIDILFNNAGSSEVGTIDDSNFVKNAKKLIDVDYFGTIYFTRAVLPIMKKNHSGHILNMSSVVGRKGFPHFGAYSAAMHAITGFNSSLRQELRDTGINVSIIHPALTQTPLFEHVKSEDMPPPFRRFTPIPVEKVVKAALNGIYYKKTRIIVPFQPKTVLLADAISPLLGDMIVKLLPNKIFAFLIGTYKGKIYQHS